MDALGPLRDLRHRLPALRPMIGKRRALIDDDRVVGPTFELCPFLHQPSNLLTVDQMN
jgi:hypothetical protein